MRVLKKKTIKFLQSEATVMNQTQATITVNDTPCPHFRGLFYYAFPWRWGTPCRYCLRYGPAQIIMITPPTPPQAAAIVQPTVVPAASYTPAAPHQEQQPPPSYQSIVTQSYTQTVAVK